MPFQQLMPPVKLCHGQTEGRHASDPVTDLGRQCSAKRLRAVGNVNAQLLKLRDAVCLFFGYMDAATTISESSGGGSASPESEWSRKKDEDSLTFGKRCLLMARNMLEPDDGEEPHQERKRGYRR